MTPQYSTDNPELSPTRKARTRLHAKTLLELGNIERMFSNYTVALAHYQESQALFHSIQDRNGEALVLNAEGLVYGYLGQYSRALIAFDRALSGFNSVGNQRYCGIVLGNIGNAYHHTGSLESAIGHYQRALEIHCDVENRNGEGSVLGVLGILLHQTGHFHQAMDHFHNALKIHRAVGNQPAVGRVLGNLGLVSFDCGKYEDAAQFHKQSLHIHQTTGASRSEGIALGNLGESQWKLGLIQAAISNLQRAIALCDEALPLAAQAFRGTLAIVFAQNDAMEEARKLLQDGQQNLKDQPLECAKFLCKSARVYLISGERNTAAAMLNAAREIANRAQLPLNSPLNRNIENVSSL